MKTGNFPRVAINCHQLNFQPGENDWLISITDADGEDLETHYQFDRVMFQKFNDTQKIGEGEISDQQAAEIAEFIKAGIAASKNIWANCHAGICRSGAVAAILIDLGYENPKSVGSPSRLPNSLVYKKIRLHFPELLNSWELQTSAGVLIPYD